LGPAYAYAIIGDGGRERRILAAAAEKYDHGKVIRIPVMPIYRGGTGLTPAVRKLAILLSKTVVATYVMLMDREHVSSVEQVERALAEHGFATLKAERLHEGCWRVEVERGGRRATVYVVVLGREKCVEEDLASLIQARFGEPVEGEKRAVDSWLRRRGLKDGDVVREASREEFRKAFPQLAAALEGLAGDPLG